MEYINTNNGIYNITPKYCEKSKQNFVHICTLHFTSARVRSGPRTWYICKSTPLFKDPKQQETTSINILATHSTVVSNYDYDKKLRVIIIDYVRQLDNCVCHTDTTNMSKRATPSLVMTVAPIEDGAYLLTHNLDTVTQQKATNA